MPNSAAVDDLQARLDRAADAIKNKAVDAESAKKDAAAIAKEALELERSGTVSDAIAVLAHGARIFTCDPGIRALLYNNLACVEKRAGDTEAALMHLEDAVDCEGGEDLAPASTLLNLSAAVLALGYFAAAVRVAQQALKRLLKLQKPLSAQNLFLLATARYNLGVALRELGDMVKGRNELEHANDIFIDHPKELPTTVTTTATTTAATPDREQQQQQPPAPLVRLKSAIEAALALPYHAGGTSPAVPEKERERLEKQRQEEEHDGHTPQRSGRDAADSTPMGELVIAVASPPSRSKSKFSKMRGLSSSTGSTTPKPGWDNTTTPGVSAGVADATAAAAVSPTPNASRQLLADASNTTKTGGGGALIVTSPTTSLGPNTSAFSRGGQPPAPPGSSLLAASGVATMDPSIELRLDGTFVPLRLVRLTEEVRFRESCRRIALARARLEDIHDFRLLMQRDRVLALEEEARVETEVEQARLLGVVEYWVEFKIALLAKAGALGEEEARARSAVADECVAVASDALAAQAAVLHFMARQDTLRHALDRQQAEALESIRRAFAERNAYFAAKDKLALAQLQALACALSTWAWDCALRGENTVGMLRPEMQHSPIVLLRSLTFGHGKWQQGGGGGHGRS